MGYNIFRKLFSRSKQEPESEVLEEIEEHEVVEDENSVV